MQRSRSLAAAGVIQHDTQAPRNRIKRENHFIMCFRIRFTFLFAGLILLAFGSALRLTFNGNDVDKKTSNADRKFMSSMKLAGDFLLATSCITLLVATSLLVITAVHRQRSLSQHLTEEPEETLPELSCVETSSTGADNASLREQQLHQKSFFRRVLSTMLRNWKIQGEWAGVDLETGDVGNVNSSRSCMNDQPPDYTTVLASTEGNPPPPYSVST